jgi:deoxyribonuclease V
MKPLLWPADIHEAKKIQTVLRDKVRSVPLRRKPEFIAGVDASFTDKDVIGVACLFRYDDLAPLEDSHAVLNITFPYISGFLSFREGPAIIAALKKLKVTPDLILFDGQGIAHPKSMGIASHIGVILDIPTIGCAKSRLIGEYDEPGINKGNWSRLKYQGRIVGAVLRTRDNVKPVFVSPGHKIDLENSIYIVLRCTDKYRLPEPVRRADSLSKKLKRQIPI